MLTPLDIQNKEFKRNLKGYSMQEVDEFLNLVIDGYERLYRENMESKNKITKLEESINQYKNIESTLQNTLVIAQSAGEQVQKNAEEKAANIIAEANNKAKKIVDKSFDDVKKLEYRYEDLKRSIDVYTAKMTALLESQLGLLKQAATSDETLAELRGMKEALEEVESIEKEIEITKEEISDNTVCEDTNDILEEVLEEEPVEETLEESPKAEEDSDDSFIHDFNTKEIEFLLNADN